MRVRVLKKGVDFFSICYEGLFFIKREREKSDSKVTNYFFVLKIENKRVLSLILNFMVINNKWE